MLCIELFFFNKHFVNIPGNQKCFKISFHFTLGGKGGNKGRVMEALEASCKELTASP